MTNHYTAKQLIERALNLADMSNSAFLSYDENKRYLNDAWINVYQALINKGDKQFVTEAELVSVGSGTNGYTDFKTPDDLFQISSIRDTRGFVFVRHALSEADTASGTYDIINDRIRIYGSHYSKVIVTYYRTPTYLSFPDKDVEWNNTSAILDQALNSVLLSTGEIYNVLTGDLIATITVDEQHSYVLGDGIYLEVDDEGFTVRNYKGEALNEYTAQDDVTVNYIKDRNGSIYYQLFTDSKYSAPYNVLNSAAELADVDYETDGYPKFISSDVYRGTWVFYDEASRCLEIYREDEGDYFDINISGFDVNKFAWADDFDNRPAFYLLSNRGEVYLFTYDDNGNVEYDKLNYRAGIVHALLRYGPLVSNGTFTTLKSCIPDTDMNFPNNLYFSLIACDLALRYAMKANQETTGLDNLYTNMWNELKNGLDQSGSYTRIKNVY